MLLIVDLVRLYDKWVVVLQDTAIAAAGAADAAHDHDDDERRFPCTKCTKRFARADVLKNHMAVHSDEKPFKCDHPRCERSFKYVHSDEKPFKCEHDGCTHRAGLRPNRA